MTRSSKRQRDMTARLAEHWSIREASLSEILVRLREEPVALSPSAEPERDDQLYYARRGDVACVTVRGPILRYASWKDYGGFSSYEGIRGGLEEFAASDAKRCVIDIDSPGGLTSGCSELGDYIAELAKTREVVAYVGGMAASAAYWLASQCSAIYLSNTSAVGSIGCMVAYTDTSEAASKAGFKQVKIVSSQSPNKNSDPATKAGRESVQSEVDQLADIFISAVAAGRGFSREKVLADFGQGDIVIGQKAIDVGMADGFATIEDLMGGASSNGESNTQFNYVQNPRTGESVAETDPVLSTEVSQEDSMADLTAAEMQARIAAILSAPEAEGREAQAKHLAFNTAISAADSIALLTVSAKAAAPVAAVSPPAAVAKGPTASEIAAAQFDSFSKWMAAQNPTVQPGAGEVEEKPAVSSEEKFRTSALAYAKTINRFSHEAPLV